MWRLIAIVILSLALAGNAQARGLVQAPAWVVGTHVSQEGESREEFIWRVAGIMQAWTDANDAEVCGYLATDGQRWGVKLITHRSQIMCIFDKEIVPQGFVASEDYIHTHPNASSRGHIEISEGTRAAARAVRESLHGFYIEIGIGFSDDDYRAGPGYLVQNGQLNYQKGRKTAVALGHVSTQGRDDVLVGSLTP